jgi:hypothetical protein
MDRLADLSQREADQGLVELVQVGWVTMHRADGELPLVVAPLAVFSDTVLSDNYRKWKVSGDEYRRTG